MNMVGTPYRLVAFSWATARSAARGSKPGPARMIALPWDVAARLPITIPKQWYSGGTTTMRSFSV